MEVVKATIQVVGDHRNLVIGDEREEVVIPLSKNDAKQVKSAFNKLIRRTRIAEFEVQLETDDQDLFAEVAREYIKQLNREIEEVRREMKRYGLVHD